ncbi:MAG: hypothetical protein KDA80_12070 [Planctomycetaceae bacterium]|nr:hypothetical protein [Planctomycetaceae bacterium]
MKKRRVLLMMAGGLTLVGILAFGVLSVVWDSQQRTMASYRTIKECFAIRQSQGWSLHQVPTDGRRYRVCGATESSPAISGNRFRGSFQAGERSVKFDVQVPDGKIVAVEGLDPIDGGQLTYAVLMSDVNK